MTSRLMRLAFMPSVPMDTPSETAIVLNSIGVPPPARMPCLHELGQPPLVVVAGHGLDPRRRDPDEWPGQVVVGESDGLEHRSRRGTIRAVRQGVGVPFPGSVGRL